MNPLNIAIPIIGAAALLGMTEADASTPIIDYGPDMNKNLESFMALIREGESSNNYRAMYGGGSVSDFSHHPGWSDASMTQKSSWAGANNSHAAGAYQFQPQTYKEASDATGINGDFSPESQDIAAAYLIQRRGATSDIINGYFQSAIDKLRDEWDFLNHWSYDDLLANFQNGGGNIS